MQVTNILSCPACKNDVTELSYGFACTNKECIHSRNDCFFIVQDGIPALISEEACDTVFRSSQSEPMVVRSDDGVVLRWVKKHIAGESKVTKENIVHFLGLLKAIETPRVLIIGSGQIGSGTDILYSSDIQIVGLDVYASPTVDYKADAHYLPFKDAVFDGVLIQAVLEHVVDPPVVVSEIHRVLKKDGLVYAETPFMQQVHEGAYDFTRYTVLGHRYLFKNFDSIRFGGLDGAGVVLAWSIKAFVQAISRSRLLAKIAYLPFKYVLTIFEKIADPRSLHDANSGSFFLGKRSNNSISHQELIKGYKGFDR